jgi:hypothetical protein
MAREAVSAARRGERVAAMTERRERIATIRSRYHSGQFYSIVSFRMYGYIARGANQWIIGVIRRLGYE